MRCGYVLMNLMNETAHFAMTAAEPVRRRLQDDSAVTVIAEVQLQPGGDGVQIVFNPEAMSFDRLCRTVLEVGGVTAICVRNASQREVAERVLREFNEGGQRRATRVLDLQDVSSEY